MTLHDTNYLQIKTFNPILKNGNLHHSLLAPTKNDYTYHITKRRNLLSNTTHMSTNGLSTSTIGTIALLYLNNNLHIVHHANPAVAWYDLPDLYQERRELFLAANEHTLFNGYGDILRRFAFRVKQPVDHPFMYRETTQEVVVE